MKSFRTCIFLLCLMLTLSIFVQVAQAKDLTYRIGLGFNGQVAASYGNGGFQPPAVIPSISVKYWITDAIGIQGLVGFDTWGVDDVGGYDILLGGKFLYNLIQEENMNFFLNGGGGLLIIGADTGSDTDSDLGISLFGGAGFEWFFQGLPNLGFDVEVGLQYTYIDDAYRFGSYGGAFGTFGVHYYF